MTDWLTRQQAARLLQVSTCTLDRYRRKGLVTPYRRVGTNRVWFKREEIMDLSTPTGGDRG